MSFGRHGLCKRDAMFSTHQQMTKGTYRFCALNCNDPTERLKSCDEWEDLGTFWKWYLDHHNVESEDSLDQYRKRFALLYKRHTGRAMDDDMAKNVRNVSRNNKIAACCVFNR